MLRVEIDELEFEDAFVLHDGKLFTGVSIERWSTGTLRAEQAFELGLKHGMLREYSNTGRLIGEVALPHGVLHGLGRWWHEDGRPATEELAKYGTVLWRKEWDDQGNLIEDDRLDESDELYQDVVRQETRSGSLDSSIRS